jgi:outer membrane cobalamin receptor
MLPILLALLQTGLYTLRVTDTSGTPLAGVRVESARDSLIGATDQYGVFTATEDISGDSIAIASIGFATWLGPAPDSGGNVYLETVPVPSGVVIQVVAERRSAAGQIPSTVYLGTDDLEDLSLSGMRSLTGKSAGVSVREYGGAMPVLSVSMRGAEPGQISWFVDGHRIDSARDGSPGGLLDPAIFGGLELARGGSSAYIGGGLAGIVAFRPESSDMPSFISLGGDDRGGARAVCRFPLAGTRLGISLRRLVGAGGSTGYSVSTILSGSVGGFSYGILGSHSDGEAESPDWTLPTDGVRSQTSLDVWSRVQNGRFFHDFGLRLGNLTYRSAVPVPFDDRHRDGSADLGSGFRIPLPGGSLLVRGAMTFEWLESDALGSRDRTRAEGAAEFSGSFGPLSLSAACLGEFSPSGTSPGARVSLGIPIFEPCLACWVSGARSYHNPSFNDLYWPADAFAEGNPELEPETSWEAEAGLTLRAFDLLDATSTVFLARTDDLIIWLPGTGGIWSPENISRARRAGLETSVHVDLSSMELSGNFTWLDATDLTDGSVNYGLRLPYRPEYTWGVDGKVCCFVRGLDLSLSAFGSGLRFTNSSQTTALPSYAVLSSSASIELPWFTGVSLALTVTNVLDEDYEETSGYKGIPRTIGLHISWMEDSN